MTRRIRLFALAALLAAGGLLPSLAVAQELRPRFGLGFNTTLTTAEGVLGLGLRSRVSAPVNADLSFGVDVGLTGFILGGRDDASYVFDPQISAIVTLDSRQERTPYILGGLGAYVPFGKGDDGESGPTLHGGFGWVQALQNTTLFYEINPALIIGETAVDLVLPFRVGIIL